jgi:hypothetical protein
MATGFSRQTMRFQNPRAGAKKRTPVFQRNQSKQIAQTYLQSNPSRLRKLDRAIPL